MTVRNRSLTTLIPIAALMLSAGCGHDEERRADARLEPLSVKVIEVARVTGPKPIDVRGTVQAARQANVSSRVMGPVVALKVRAGAKVAKGQILLEIHPETSEGQLAQAQGGLAQANAALSLAERNYQRFEALHAEKAASDLELDMAKMQFEQASGAVTQAEGAVRAASSVAKESIVRAPFAARVMETMVEVGDLAAPGRPLVRLESLEEQQLWLTVREADNHRVEIGHSSRSRSNSCGSRCVRPTTTGSRSGKRSRRDSTAAPRSALSPAALSKSFPRPIPQPILLPSRWRWRVST